MSDSLHLVCKTCRTYLWYGQFPYGQPERAYVYTTEAAAKDLAVFSCQHMGHDLAVMNDQSFELFDDGDEPLAEFERTPSRSCHG